MARRAPAAPRPDGRNRGAARRRGRRPARRARRDTARDQRRRGRPCRLGALAPLRRGATEHVRERLVLHLERLLLAARRRHEGSSVSAVAEARAARCRGRMADAASSSSRSRTATSAIAWRSSPPCSVSALGVMLQFSRETTEATPTALLLGAERRVPARGRAARWDVAVGRGGYRRRPLALLLSERPALARPRGARLPVPRRSRGLAVPERRAAGATATALAALLTLGPFLATPPSTPTRFSLRARQVSVFSEENAAAPALLRPRLELVQLVWEQLEHSLGDLREHARLGRVLADRPTDPRAGADRARRRSGSAGSR